VPPARRSGTPRKPAAARKSAALAAAEIRALRRLQDEAEIRAAMELYFHCIDSRAFRGLRNVFTEDAIYDFAGGAIRFRGWSEVAEGMSRTLKGGDISSSNHFNTSVRIRLAGDSAASDSHAMVALMSGRGGNGAGAVVTRGLRYKDTWVRTPRGWRISHRIHLRTWTMETPAVRPVPVGTKGQPGIR
jgi:ketosteroid isomerase-like protein